MVFGGGDIWQDIWEGWTWKIRNLGYGTDIHTKGHPNRRHVGWTQGWSWIGFTFLFRLCVATLARYLVRSLS